MNAREYSDRLFELLRTERDALADFLLALSRFHRDRLWIDLGYASLFAFLRRELRLSEGAAYYRMKGAELLLEFPEVIEPLRDGRLCYSSIVELAKNLTRENVATLLPRFFHASKREAKAGGAPARRGRPSAHGRYHSPRSRPPASLRPRERGRTAAVPDRAGTSPG